VSGLALALAEGRAALVAAGSRLLAEGLVARSWGNLSLRLSDRTMAITPSGIPYPDLREDMIALVDLRTGEWSGVWKPSGERELHRLIYLARPDARAIVHTHQNAASACAAARAAVPSPWGQTPCAPYAPPGTNKLARVTTAALGGGPAVLLANHGALAVALNLDKAFDVALKLESAAADFLMHMSVGALPARPDAAWNPNDLSSVTLADDTSVLVSSAPYTLAWAERAIPLPAVLDDLAQIVGMKVPVTATWPERCPKSEALLVKGRGLLSRGADAEAIAMVVEKAARACICGDAVGGAIKLHAFEAAIMRVVYKRSYAKRAVKAANFEIIKSK
jgi:ribulose-5-phosphate 4-epimerase/fuculose-1-phosphate aldolase